MQTISNCSFVFYCHTQTLVCPKINISALRIAKDFWVVEDRNGATIIAHLPSTDASVPDTPSKSKSNNKFPQSLAPKPLRTYHSGAVTALVAAKNAQLCATAGKDGTVRCFHLATGKQLQRTNVRQGIVCLLPWPERIDKHARCYLAGTYAGCLYVLWRALEGFKVLQACKPHKVGVGSNSRLACVLGVILVRVGLMQVENNPAAIVGRCSNKRNVKLKPRFCPRIGSSF